MYKLAYRLPDASCVGIGSFKPLLLHLSRLRATPLAMPFLVVREPGRVASTIPIEGTIRIGRNPGVELALSDRQISRHHATMSCEGGIWTVSDLGSRHGIRVNGVPCMSHRPTAGDRVATPS